MTPTSVNRECNATSLGSNNKGVAQCAERTASFAAEGMDSKTTYVKDVVQILHLGGVAIRNYL